MSAAGEITAPPVGAYLRPHRLRTEFDNPVTLVLMRRSVAPAPAGLPITDGSDAAIAAKARLGKQCRVLVPLIAAHAGHSRGRSRRGVGALPPLFRKMLE